MERELDIFYEASTALLEEKSLDNYLKLLDLATVQKLKLYLCKIIPQEFQYFPEAQEKALNVQWDLCEDDDIAIRKEAIRYLPIMAKSFASRIADVLWQFMQSDYDDELLVVKEALKNVLNEYTMEAFDAFLHQILNTPEVRDRAVDFLVLNYSSTSKDIDKVVLEKLVMSMDTIEYSTEQAHKLIKFITKNFSSSLTFEIKELIVEKITNVGSFQVDSKEIVQKANSCLGFFKEGVSSTRFLEFLKKLWDSSSLENIKEAKVFHLHLLMLFADLIGFQKLEGDYIGLFPNLLLKFYSTGLGDLEDKNVILMVEPIVYCVYQTTCSSPSIYLGNQEFNSTLRQIFSSSQAAKDGFAAKVQFLEQIKQKSNGDLNNLKQLRKQLRAVQNVFNMTREILKPPAARRKLVVALSWKPEPVERKRAPSDSTLVSSSSISKRKPTASEEPSIISPKKRTKVSAKNSAVTKKKEPKTKVVKRNYKQDNIMPIVQKAGARMEVSKDAMRKSQLKSQGPKLKKSSLAIAGTAARTGLTHTEQIFPRHISLLRPNPASANSSIFKKAAGAAFQSSLNQKTSKRIVTFGPQLKLI